MSEHPKRPDRLEHPPVEPFPKVLWAIFSLALLYLVLCFASTGAHYLTSSGGHA